MVVKAGVDAGNHRVKIFGDHGESSVLSHLGEYRERNLENSMGSEDIVFEYNGTKGFAGTLAENESEFAYSLAGDSKAHPDLLLRVLIGLHRYCPETEFKIVVGQPIEKHKEAEKKYMKELLVGEHDITLNGVHKHIVIHRAEVAAEGAAAYWSCPKPGKVHILDFGSGTTNAATLIDGKYIDRESFTEVYGMETVLTNDPVAMAKAVAAKCLRRRWRPYEPVYLVGGKPDAFIEPLKEFFETVDVLRPKVNNGSSLRMLPSIYANAVAFYNIAKEVYKDGEVAAHSS